ncbi:MAG: thiol:disulfide interchange protein, partial [Proteobacteria bacterium]|nr:thiol:disulfide interchange protein [Pseudomonadota bacterium]
MLRRSPLASGPGRRLHALAVAALWVAASMGAPAWAAPVKTEHAEVELLSEHTALTAGEANTIGLAIQHAPKWHSYWQNPGDAGYPTKITWQLPSGYGVGDIQWPTPKRLPTGPIINFGYDGEVLLPMTLSVPRSARVGEPVTLRGKAEWLVCKDVCVPEEAELALTLPVADGAAAAVPGPAAA